VIVRLNLTAGVSTGNISRLSNPPHAVRDAVSAPPRLDLVRVIGENRA
jgi:hypothetical protein